MMRTSISFLLLCLVTTPMVAQKARRHVEDGNRLYAEEKFSEAREKYLEALRADPGSPLIRFNEGNALYRGADFANALESFKQAVETDDPIMASKAWYNMGNALYRNRQLQESAEAYKQALRINPNDQDAKYNLEYVLQQMEQQEQEQQQDQEPQQEQEQQQDEDEGEGEQQEQEQENNNEGEQPPSNEEQQPEESPQPQPQAGQGMTREQAERLLQAIQEDPNEIKRGPKVMGPRARVAKKW